MTRLALAALLLSASFPAFSQDEPPPPPQVKSTAQNPLATRRGWEVGGQIAGYHYEEPDFITITGARVGVVGAYTFTLPRRVFIRLDARLSAGSLDYQGSGSKSGVPDLIFETRAVAGMDFPAGRTTLSPYLGLGYRYLYNDLTGASSTGAVGYRRYSNYLYAPVGMTLRVGLGGSWVFAPTGEFDIFIQGKQKSMLSDANAGFNDVTNTQKSGYGYRVYLMFEKNHLAIGPYLHYWHIDDSDIQPTGLGGTAKEPENWTREIGIEVRYRF